MDIIKRNFYLSIRRGAFGEEVLLEPMSDFKWRKLRTMAEQKDVLCYLDPTAPHDAFTIDEQQAPNIFLNRRLNKIRYNEEHAIDTAAEALSLLNLIIYNTNQILSRGINLRGIVELGLFLRTKGDKVDFIKLEEWINRLYLQPMAKMQCSFLIRHFNFEINELPFITSEIKMPSRLALGAIHFLNLCSRRLSEIEE